MGEHLTVKAPIDGFKEKLAGKFWIEVTDPDGTVRRSETPNLIVDNGIKRLGDILAAVEATNISLGYIEPGSSATAPAPTDTDTGSALTPADRLPSTLSRNSVSPFDVTVSAFISSTKYTRPQTIRELCVFFPPDETGTMFARGVLVTPITLNSGSTATISYGIIFR